MAESTSVQDIQFGDDIRPVKSAGIYTTAQSKDPVSISEKGSYDLEERAAHIADADLNSKKKQVGR
jgi:hypothetical protein